MPRAEFSEDQFEQELMAELRENGVPHFKPSRVLESYLQYDIGLVSSDPRLVAAGVYTDDDVFTSLLPQQQRALVPHRFVSCFLQAKVPFRVNRSVTSNQHIWVKWNRWYYRFDIRKTQNDRLAHIEGQIADRARVVYAAPCFHTFRESEQLVKQHAVAINTHFQSPAKLTRHDVYTYIEPLVEGIAFSEPERIAPVKFDSELGFITPASGQTNRSEPLAAHIAAIWSGVDMLARSGDLGTERARAWIASSDQELAFVDRTYSARIRRAPLDPEGWWPILQDSRWPGDPAFATVGSFAAALFMVRRFVRESGRGRWRIFFGS